MNIWSLILFWLGINAAPANYNSTEYYEDAFERQFKTVWEGTIFYEDVSIKSLSFYRAMTCLYDSGQSDIIDRRALLYSYLSGFFETGTLNSTLDRYKQIIPIDSEIKQVMSRICKLYDEPPERLFSEKETTQDKLTQLYDDIKIDSYMQETYQKGKLTGNIAVYVKVIEDKLYLIRFSPDLYRVMFEDDGITVKEVFYPDYVVDEDGKQAVVIKSWTNEEFRTRQYTTGMTQVKLIKDESEPNNYGVIPWVFLTMGEDFYPSTKYELAESQLNLNKVEFQSRLDVDFNATPVKIAVNIPQELIKVSPDAMIIMNNVAREGIEELVEPTIKFVDSEPKFDMLQEHKGQKSNEMQRGQGIPNSMLQGDSEPPSGISRLLEMSELLEIEGKDIPILQEFEKKLLDMIVLVMNQDASDFNINENDIKDFAIHYPPPAIVVEPEMEYDFDKTKVKDNVMDIEIFLKKHGNVNASESFDNLVKIVEERKEKFDQLKPFSNAPELETPVNDETSKQLDNIEDEINPTSNIEEPEDENS